MEVYRKIRTACPHCGKNVTAIPSERAIADYQRDMVSSKNLLRILGENTYLQNINRNTVENYKSTRQKEGVSCTSVNREFTLLKHLFKLAV